MGYTQYTFAQLQSLGVEHALMRTPDARVTAAQIVNRALEYLVNYKTWGWRRTFYYFDFTALAITSLVRASNTVTLTRTAHGLSVGDQIRVTGAIPASFNGVQAVLTVPTADTITYANTGSDATASTPGSYFAGFLNLPSDFGGLEMLEAYQNRMLRFVQRPPVEIMRLRWPFNLGNTGLTIFYCVANKPQTAVTSLPVRRIEMAPPPSGAQVAAIQLTYFRLIPSLSGSTDVPDIPLGMHDVLLQLVRGFASRMEQPTAPATSPEWQFALELLAAAAKADDAFEPEDHGPLKGPAGEYMAGPLEWRPHDRITLP